MNGRPTRPPAGPDSVWMRRRPPRPVRTHSASYGDILLRDRLRSKLDQQHGVGPKGRIVLHQRVLEGREQSAHVPDQGRALANRAPPRTPRPPLQRGQVTYWTNPAAACTIRTSPNCLLHCCANSSPAATLSSSSHTAWNLSPRPIGSSIWGRKAATKAA